MDNAVRLHVIESVTELLSLTQNVAGTALPAFEPRSNNYD
jgi:hypothetical protein